MENNSKTALNEFKKIYCELPKGIAIGKNQFGNCILATEKFSKGTIIFTSKSIRIPDEYFDIELVTDSGIFELNSIVHGIKYAENQRALYTFDCFVNHSCDPSMHGIYSHEEDKTENWALRDIEPGDEINSDYCLFEYDCEDKSIERCACGSKKCLGKVFGFKFLNEEQKKERIKTVDKCILDQWVVDPDIRKDSVIYDDNLIIPENVNAVYSAEADTVHLTAQKDFEIGDIIYNNTSRYVFEDCTIIVSLLNTRIWLDNSAHTLARGELGREYCGIDSFRILGSSRGEEKNTSANYQRESETNSYNVVAIKPIKAGERLFS